MPAAHATARYPLGRDAPRVDLIETLPMRRGRLNPADIRKAVTAVVNKRLAAERAAKASK